MTTERGFDRLVNFSDAVVAIAISLLILPVVDDVSGHIDTGAKFFSENGSRLIAFVVSFVVIARFWFAHHQIFETVIAYTRPILWANFLWLLSVVFVPLPTEMLGAGQATHDAFTRFIYCGSLFASSASLVLVEWLVSRSPHTWRDSTQGPQVMRGVGTALMFLLATIIAVTIEPIGLWALVLVVLGDPIGRWMERGFVRG